MRITMLTWRSFRYEYIWSVAYDLRDGTFWYTIKYSKPSADRPDVITTSSGPTLERLRDMDNVTFSEDLR